MAHSGTLSSHTCIVNRQMQNADFIAVPSSENADTAENIQNTTSSDRMPATLLLIDDNAIQAATRQTILKRAGYFVIAVLSPQRALEQLRANEYPAHIDLIITDHVMPGMNGSEFVTQLRKFSPTVPVLVISGMIEAEDEYAGLDIQFRLKPLLPDNLLASVHRLVDPQD
jgi:CheY-like chemotaxis protein